MNIFESLENLNVSEECFEDIVGLVEAELKKYQSGLKDSTIDSMVNKRMSRFQNNPNIENHYKASRALLTRGNVAANKVSSELGEPIPQEVKSHQAAAKARVAELKKRYDFSKRLAL